jgi:anti-sigma regulatory factor (Ser/Thr protein kinase)
VTVAGDSVALLLPYEPRSAGAARRLIRTALCAWRLGELVEAGELVVSELAGNAVKTGCRKQMAVEVLRVTDRCVRISVSDGSRAMPCLIDASSDSESGRGLALVHYLTGGHWGVSLHGTGKTIHADLHLLRPPRTA